LVRCNKASGLCNCEGGESSADVGTFFDSQAGIEMFYVKKLDAPGSANITIGPLVCYGDSGYDAKRTWTLKVGDL
jgi:hypothetical protein